MATGLSEPLDRNGEIYELLLAACAEARETGEADHLLALLVSFAGILVAFEGGSAGANGRRWARLLVDAVEHARELGARPRDDAIGGRARPRRTALH